MQRNAHYSFIFILRLWRDSDAEAPDWRFIVEDTATGVRRGFGDLRQAVRFIESEMQASTSVGDDSG